MKIATLGPIVSLLIISALAGARVRGDVTCQNCLLVTGDEQSVFSIGQTDVDLRPIEPAKAKDLPQVALFIGDTRATRTPIYPGKRYHFAVISKDGKTQCFLNGQPDGLALDLDFRAGDLKAITPEKNRADVKAIIAQTGHHPITTVGHRGDNRFSPENTNISYVNAIAAHTPIVEMDLRLTSDNVLVLMHDPTVNRTTDGKGPIVEKSLAEVQKLDAGSWKDAKFKGEPVPKVEDIARTCRDKAIMMLDLKCTGLGKSLAELKQKLNSPSDQWILARWEEPEARGGPYLPDVPMILLHGKLPTDNFDDAYFARMKQTGFSAFSIDWRNISQAFIDAAHKHEIKIYVWTVNDAPDVAGAVLANVDGIITDDVAATMKLVDELTTKP